MSPAKANPRNRRIPDLRSNNVVTQQAKGVQLRCGHSTKAMPLVSSPTARWWCEECRALQGSK